MSCRSEARSLLRTFGAKPVVIGDNPETIGLRTLADRLESDQNYGQAQKRRTVIRIATSDEQPVKRDDTVLYNNVDAYVVDYTELVTPDGLFTDVIVRAAT